MEELSDGDGVPVARAAAEKSAAKSKTLKGSKTKRTTDGHGTSPVAAAKKRKAAAAAPASIPASSASAAAPGGQGCADQGNSRLRSRTRST